MKMKYTDVLIAVLILAVIIVDYRSAFSGVCWIYMLITQYHAFAADIADHAYIQRKRWSFPLIPTMLLIHHAFPDSASIFPPRV